MAMFPNAAHGYMPFVHGAGKTKRTKNHVNGGKLHKHTENRKLSNSTNMQKLYQITLRDKKGNVYKCIVPCTTSLPELTEPTLNAQSLHRSLPDMTSSPSKQRRILDEKLDALNSSADVSENFSTSLDLRNCGKKEGIFSALVRFIKEKTGNKDKRGGSESKTKDVKSKSNAKLTNGKSKRKPKDLSQRKRQRTVSAMSNLDPIDECLNEAEFEDVPTDDNESYSHFSSGYPSDNDSITSQISCNVIAIEAQS